MANSFAIICTNIITKECSDEIRKDEETKYLVTRFALLNPIWLPYSESNTTFHIFIGEQISAVFFVNYDTHHMRISLRKKFEKYDFNEET